MSLARFFAAVCGVALLTNCSSVLPTIGEQSDVHQLYTDEAPAVAFAKALQAVLRAGGTVTRTDEKAGTIQATAYRGKVTVYLLIRPTAGQTRVEAIARTEPGTFSHGKLDVAERILARYQEAP